MKAKLLHLSDIHFRPDSELGIDPDALYRDHIIEKIAESAAERRFDCIFVSGDIAARGSAAEYAVAKLWLDRVGATAGCGDAGIYVVPGNHDIDRTVTRDINSVRLVQASIASARTEREREHALARAMADPDNGPALFRALAAYNQFAEHYECEIGPSEFGRWDRTLDLSHGYRLKIFGLTSVLCSSCSPPGGDDKRGGTLYVGPQQCTMRQTNSDIGVAIIHHPPDWLQDGDLVNRAFKNNTKLQFLGHKHSRDVDRGDGFVRFGAGAVSPDRHEAGFEPGFNIIALDIVHDTDGRYLLDVDAEVWTWQDDPGRFRRHETRDGEQRWHHMIRLPTLPAAPAPMVATDRPPPPLASGGAGHGPHVQRFWALSRSGRQLIADTLGLLSEDEKRLPDRYRYQNIFARAARDGKLDRLIDAIQVEGTKQ